METGLIPMHQLLADIDAASSGTSVVITILDAEKIDGDFKSPTVVEPFVLTLR